MAAIDLRSATIFVKDTSTGTDTAVINNADGYEVGTKVLAITGTVAVGQYISIGTNLEWYAVVATGTGTISILPALMTAAADGDAITAGGNAIYAKIGEGNLTYNEKRNLVYIRDRGFIDTVKLGDDEPMEVSLDFTWEFLRGVSGIPPTFEEAIKHIGLATTWTSTSVDPCEPYSVDIVIIDVPPCGSDSEQIILPEFRWETMDHDLKGAKVAVKGTCNVLLAIVTHPVPAIGA